MEGDHGLLKALKEQLESRKHAVIVIAEDAGQDLIANPVQEKDASGNIRLQDIGRTLPTKSNPIF